VFEASFRFSRAKLSFVRLGSNFIGPHPSFPSAMAVDDFIMTFNSDDELPTEDEEAPQFVGTDSGSAFTKTQQQQQRLRTERKSKEGKRNGRNDRKRKRSVLEAGKNVQDEDVLGAIDHGFSFDGLGGGHSGGSAADIYVSVRHPYLPCRIYLRLLPVGTGREKMLNVRFWTGYDRHDWSFSQEERSGMFTCLF
jgi:hypothetical protein